MPSRLLAAMAACALMTAGQVTFANAQPPPDQGEGAQPMAESDAPPPAPITAVASRPAGYLKTPEGWELTVGAKDETQQAVPPLTTAVSSREYLVGGTFTGSVTGQGTAELTGGSLEAGYRIGCGIIGGPVELESHIGTETVFNPFLQGTSINGQIKVNLRPGTVTVVPIGEKDFTGGDVRVTITGLRVKIDSCVGQSFLQSYATLKSSTADTDDIVSYVGEVKVV